MFPKNTVATKVDLSPEKPTQKTADSAVTIVVDVADQRIDSQQGRWEIKRAVIYACAVVMTTLILVGGVLGTLPIVFPVNEPFVAEKPLHGDKNFPFEVSSAQPRIKIDDGGLWSPQQPVTPDLVTAADVGQEDVSVASTRPESNVVVVPLSKKEPVLEPSGYNMHSGMGDSTPSVKSEDSHSGIDETGRLVGEGAPEQRDKSTQPEMSSAQPPVKIDDSGLWSPQQSLIPDIITIGGVGEEGIFFASPEPEGKVVVVPLSKEEPFLRDGVGDLTPSVKSEDSQSGTDEAGLFSGQDEDDQDSGEAVASGDSQPLRPYRHHVFTCIIGYP